MAGPVLYTLGAILMHCPGSLNPQEAIEEFGYDYAVKPVVGAQPPREKVGQADTHLNRQAASTPTASPRPGSATGRSRSPL